MSGRDVGGDYRTDRQVRVKARAHKERCRAANRCICGPIDDRPSKRKGIVHGPVVRADKCQRCLDVAARSRAKGRAA